MKRMKGFFLVSVFVCLANGAYAQRMPFHQPGNRATFQQPAPSTTNVDDSCDIMVTPAATLLLPYFEVETTANKTDTFFTITNTSAFPQIAHVTVWTDWSFPVLVFNVFLTGYDVQSISLFDVIAGGVIAPPSGTSSSVAPGSQSAQNTANPNLQFVNICNSLPGSYTIQSAVLSALTTGIYNPGGLSSCGGTPVGSPAASHPTATTAVGYVTVDVTSVCSNTLPTNPAYFSSEILYDNVLMGDYQILNKALGSNYAGGDPMVHIRAIPEGGPAGVLLSGQQTSLPFTFYGRYFTSPLFFTPPGPDRRQPLPSTFAARWIQGGTGSFNTNYRIWREGRTGASVNVIPGVTPTNCAGAVANSALPIAEIVRFDEHENPMVFAPGTTIALPEASSFSTSTSTYPPLSSPSGDTAGWMYLNLNSGLVANGVNTVLHPAFPQPRPSQNWVVVSMTAGGSTSGLFGVDFDATQLGNGCVPAVAISKATGGAVPIGPAGGVLVCPPADPGCVPNSGLYVGTNTTP